MGPKPASDPAQWCQASRAEPLGGGPPDVLHYSPCINHPAWREYLDLVVRQLAGVGYDGMFFDVNTLECFFAEHADLWQGGTSWARVGLLFWNDQVFYEHTAHLAMVHRLVQVLAEAQVPFDLVTEEGSRGAQRGTVPFLWPGTTPGVVAARMGTVPATKIETVPGLQSYEVLLAPMLRYLDDAQIARLLNYARQGGNLVVIDPFGTDDKAARPRWTDPLTEFGGTRKEFCAAACGQGKLLRLSSAAVPARRSDLWCLREARANDFVRASDYLNEARRAERRSGMDFGPEFIKRLEAVVAMTLRWCPPRTDPAVYLHAYHLPPVQGRPERLAVHAVNYRVPILLDPAGGKGYDRTRAGEAVVHRGLSIRVPLPRATGVKRVEALSPTDSCGPVKWSVRGRHLALTVEELKIYQALVVELE